jgi:hypothetical protein
MLQIMFHEHRSAHYPPLYHHLIDGVYDKQHLYFIDGADVPGNLVSAASKRGNEESYARFGHAFIRELHDGCSGWKFSGPWKTDAQNLPMYYAE